MKSTHRHSRLGLIALLILAGCSSEKNAGGNKAGGSAEQVPTVVVATVAQRDVPLLMELTSRTDANETVEVRARVRAFLTAQHYREGSLVKKGQLLFTLDRREFEAKAAEAKAQLSKAQADLTQAQQRTTVQTAEADVETAQAQLNKAAQDIARLKPLAEQQAVPQQDYDNAVAAQDVARANLDGRKASLNTAKVAQMVGISQAQAAIEAANATIREAELNLEFTNITAPIDGIAGVRNVAPGNLVGQGDATLLTTISNLNPMRVLMSISERDYLTFAQRRESGNWKGAGEIELILADGSVFPYKGQFLAVDRAIDLKTGTMSVVTEFPNPRFLLRPGQFARARVSVATAAQAVLVPQKAVTEIQSARAVYVVGPNNRVSQRTVTLGQRSGESFIVTEGLQAGERIIVEGLQKTRPGGIVAPTERALSVEPKGH